jgi:glutamyl-tRNA synthetase
MRTLLYNYAFAKKNGGQFVLRVEDTDRERFVEGALERALQAITDYGLSWDEGPEVGGPFAPYIQSQRLALYKKYALELVAQGHAYYCFCTKDRLEDMRKAQQEARLPTTKYDQRCLGLSPDEVHTNLARGLEYVIRLKVPSNTPIAYTDLFLGKIAFPSNDVEDQILLKSDGFPTYHLAVVVDDHLMEITHILRGSEWLASTPKHVLLYEYFGWEMPKTGHLPVLKEVGANKKMSKRFGDVAAAEFLKNGYLPEALLNFIMLLGWNPGTEQEIFSLKAFIDVFSLEHIHKTDLVAFDREKLLWFNGYYIRQLTDAALYAKVVAWAQRWNVSLADGAHDREYTLKVLALIKDRMKTLAAFTELSDYFYTTPKVDKSALASYGGAKWQDLLTGFASVFAAVEQTDWHKEALDHAAHTFIETAKYGTKEAFMTLRVAITGSTATPPLFDVLELVGKTKVLARLNALVLENSS